jgi:hypothetical protein
MTKFEDQLFDDLMREHGPGLAHVTVPAAPRYHVTAGRAMLAGGGTLVVAGAIAGSLVASGGAPASRGGIQASGRTGVSGQTARDYKVTNNPDGTISLAVYTKSGIAAANEKLRLLGDKNVVLVQAKPGCPSMSSLRAPAVSAHMSGKSSTSVGQTGGGTTVTVDAHGIPSKDVLVIAVETFPNGTARASSEGAGRLTSNPVPACVSLPAPPAPSGTGTGSSGSGTSSVG